MQLTQPGDSEVQMGKGRIFTITMAAVVAALLGACGGGDSPSGGQNGTGGDSVIPDLVSKDNLPPAPDDEVNVALAPEMPPPIERSDPAFVDVEFEVVENVSTIDPQKGTEHETWGYRIVDGPDTTVVGTPGPVIRARVGDMLRFTITNPEGNSQPHNVDFHAVTGQGGGAEATTVLPGETRTIEARLLYPGFFMYHCAYGDVPAHIAHGMSGGILVDPATPLPEVDHEWYMVQSEYYVAGDGGLDRNAVTDENPSHVVFNGAVGALTGDNALQMQVGESARIYFVNAGLNLISSFHPIGSHWDAVYPEGALLNEPIRGSQTTLVPAGGGTVVELIGQVPQTVVLVDHALARAFDKGAIGQIVIDGEEDPEIFREVEPRAGAGEGAGDGQDREAEVVPSPEPAGTDHAVAILEGSGDFQDDDAADEFAETESPGDYSANELEVQVGDTVTWTNEDTLAHTVTDEGGEFDSGFLNTGESFSRTFDEPGEFEYFCTPHPWMRARVIVSG
ncbi:MAG: plastocyanin/azurin family copper-binding protein [Actinomycetota bacterium]